MSEELVMHIATLEVDIRSMKQDFEAMKQRAETAERQVEGYQEMVQSNLATVVAMKQRAEAAEVKMREAVDTLTEIQKNWMNTCVHHNDTERTNAASKCPVCTLTRAEAAERVIVNVRNAVNRLKPHWPMQEIEKALETAGTGYLSPAEVKERVKPLVEALRELWSHPQNETSLSDADIESILQHAKAKGWV